MKELIQHRTLTSKTYDLGGCRRQLVCSIIPIHYDNPKFPVNLKDVEAEFKSLNLNHRILEIGESTEI